jgi:hypothetical protein
VIESVIGVTAPVRARRDLAARGSSG